MKNNSNLKERDLFKRDPGRISEELGSYGPTTMMFTRRKMKKHGTRPASLSKLARMEEPQCQNRETLPSENASRNAQGTVWATAVAALAKLRSPMRTLTHSSGSEGHRQHLAVYLSKREWETAEQTVTREKKQEGGNTSPWITLVHLAPYT